MSAFLVDPEHINVMLWAATQPASDPSPLSWYFGNPTDTHQLCDENLDDVGQMLLDENAASVNYRYSDDEPSYVYHYQHPKHVEWSLAELLNALHCYEYQACERPDWHQSEAYAFCRALEHRLISRLPGYSNGPWQINGFSTPRAVGNRGHRR